ncbi:glycoside hydrolase family 68 protein [Paraurantiacibacter namhicola]|uniref:Levansucrase n=1 Tax=Paraurantiacibacter namhicola TaxID=645517 RepID=A0A1C7D6Y4_9SPHN|nr:glycoside hydrolase family 68 protein [Paraurantiacibacter namhicola]ANU07063.1 Levansucrase [Paraurantiacibacter namhicola]
MTTAWISDHVKAIAGQPANQLPLLTSGEVQRPRSDLYYWDMWAVQDTNGDIADVNGREFWMILAAPDNGDPGSRHFSAKIHLLERLDGKWTDLGPVLPDFGGPYEREWSGSALWRDNRFTMWFTGAGLHRTPGGYQQALFEATAASDADGLPQDWSQPRPILTELTKDYIAADSHEGEAGRIKAYRDPAYFRDPADGREYLVFTASHPAGDSEFTGAIGIAEKVGWDWELRPPIIHSGGVNNELERAHIVHHEGMYFAFWATQSSTFAPELSNAPTGLYGMMAENLHGPYRPLNGSGLVLANPTERPSQLYSWSVTRELLVSSFVECIDHDCSEFAGAPSPLARLSLDVKGGKAALVGLEPNP